MSDKRTGILTLSAAQNYGAVLQSYALCKFVNDHFSNCEIIDFMPKFIDGRYPVFYVDTSSAYKMLRSTVGSMIRLPAKYSKKTKFEKFRNIYCKYSKKKFKYFMNEDCYDQYIVGSDQVFNLELTRNDLAYFLPSIHDCRKKATYAASLGVSSLTEEQKKTLTDNLESFGHISIREETGCQLIRELLPNKEIVKKIDPVFLIESEQWNTLVGKRKYKEKYILIYTFKGFDLAYKIAKEYDSECKIVYISDEYKKIRNDVCNARGVGPQEFLSLIKYAEYIITDSFHGAAFSIIFNKSFSPIPYKGTESRLLNMLEQFNLSNRVVAYDVDDMDFSKINYAYANTVIDELRKDSYHYLEQLYKK